MHTILHPLFARIRKYESMTILEIKNISKSFGGVKAVHDVSFALEREKITALIGPNGAGKTTLFNIVNGFLSGDEGSIIFEEQDVTHRPAYERSRLGMSRTFQLSRVFKNLTIGENLMLAARMDDNLFWRSMVRPEPESVFHERIQKAIVFVGLDKPLNTPVTDLSYGQQKLFDLARAIVNPHTMLLLDEPVAGVNPVIREKLKSLMQDLRTRKESVLLIEHDMDFVRGVADRVIVMAEGEVIADGLPEEVLRHSRVLEAYLGVTT